jgi:hypothetical protein
MLLPFPVWETPFCKKGQNHCTQIHTYKETSRQTKRLEDMTINVQQAKRQRYLGSIHEDVHAAKKPADKRDSQYF